MRGRDARASGRTSAGRLASGAMARAVLVLGCLTLLATTVVGGQATGAGAAAAPVTQERSAPVSNDPVLEEKTRLVAAELRCPVCQGNSIQDSPSELAQEMKGVVRDQLASGKTPEEVKQYFVAKYGEWILLEPEPSGFNLVAYLLPLAAVLAGALVIWRSVKKWTAPAESMEGTQGE